MPPARGRSRCSPVPGDVAGLRGSTTTPFTDLTYAIGARPEGLRRIAIRFLHLTHHRSDHCLRSGALHEIVNALWITKAALHRSTSLLFLRCQKFIPVDGRVRVDLRKDHVGIVPRGRQA